MTRPAYKKYEDIKPNNVATMKMLYDHSIRALKRLEKEIDKHPTPQLKHLHQRLKQKSEQMASVWKYYKK